MDANQIKRKFIRFRPDPLDVAQIDIRPEAPGSSDFQPTLVALILEESPEGCALAYSGTTTLSVGALLKIKVGNLDPLVAEVRWTKELDLRLRAVGFQYKG